MQDVFQCFGRAGRPQFDTEGEAILITEHIQLRRYLGMLNYAIPLESGLIKKLPDSLNAEIVAGTVTTVEEASEWLSYTFLYIRMLKNPIGYGVGYDEKINDPTLANKRKGLIAIAGRTLDDCKMSRFGVQKQLLKSLTNFDKIKLSSPFGVTYLGRIASHYYIQHETIEMFNENINDGNLTDAEILLILCDSTEFKQIKVRDEEVNELAKVYNKSCPIKRPQNNVISNYKQFEESNDKNDDDINNIRQKKGEKNNMLKRSESYDETTSQHKTFILVQTYILRYKFDSFTLTSDMNYIAQNMSRIARAFFEIAVNKGNI